MNDPLPTENFEMSEIAQLEVQLLLERAMNSNLNPNIFARLLFKLSGAKDYIKSVSVLMNSGRLDIEATASSLSIPIVYKEDTQGMGIAYAAISGIGSYREEHPLEIWMHPYLGLRERQLSFGHEIGHYYFSEISGLDDLAESSGRGDPYIESACDDFGLMMALQDVPFEAIKEEDIDEALLMGMSELYGVKLHRVISILMEQGKLPDFVAVDGRNDRTQNPDYSFSATRTVVCKDMLGGDECGHALGSQKNIDMSRTTVFNFTNYKPDGRHENVNESMHGCDAFRAMLPVDDIYGRPDNLH